MKSHKKFLLLCLCIMIYSARPVYAFDPSIAIGAGKLAIEAGTWIYKAYQWWKDDDGKQAQEDLQRQRAASMTALMEASVRENVDELAKLIKAGENVNAKDYDGDTALTYAIAGNTPEAVKFLVDSGAYINERILRYAIIRNDPDILAIILQKNFDSKILNQELIKLNLDNMKFAVINELVKAGADINYKDNDNETLLMKLVSFEGADPQLVSKIIESGANVSLRNSGGMNSLMYAAGHNTNPEITRVILKEFYTGPASSAFRSTKPSVNARDDSGRTALMYAAGYNTAEIVDILIDSGADVTIRDKEGNKAVDYVLGWLGGNSQVKGTKAFERLGKSDKWIRPYW